MAQEDIEEPYCQKQEDNVCSEAVALPPGFEKSENASLLASAIGLPGKGGLCCGQVATVTETATEPVMLHRAWAPHYTAGSAQSQGNSNAAYQFGGWWSLKPPDTPKDKYRHMDDICTQYDALTVYSSCTIKAGTQVVIGPGQSTHCSDTQSFPQSSVLQVYVPRYGKTQGTQGHFEDCTTYFWPTLPSE